MSIISVRDTLGSRNPPLSVRRPGGGPLGAAMVVAGAFACCGGVCGSGSGAGWATRGDAWPESAAAAAHIAKINRTYVKGRISLVLESITVLPDPTGTRCRTA